MTIPIIFYAGTHGNYVEFTLNKMIHGNDINLTNPLGALGTSHAQRTDSNYRRHRKFKCYWHNTFFINQLKKQPCVIIDFDDSNDIFVLQLVLKRGEDYNIDPDELEHNTYNKLFGKP